MRGAGEGLRDRVKEILRERESRKRLLPPESSKLGVTTTVVCCDVLRPTVVQEKF